MLNQKTGYPEIDRPWMKYYDGDAIFTTPPHTKYTSYILSQNKGRLSEDALDYLGKRITYAELFEHVRNTAKGMQAIGIKKGDIVTVFSINTPETIYCVFALNLLGAIPCIEYVTESIQEAKATVERCESKTVILLDVLAEKFAELAAIDSLERIIILPLAGSMPFVKKAIATAKIQKHHVDKELLYGDLISKGKKEQLQESDYDPDATAIILHSGGTTGIPKSILLTNDNLCYVAWAFSVGGSDTAPGDVLYSCIPLFHAFGFTCGIVMPLVIRQTLALAVKYDEQSFVESFKRLKPNHTMSSSTYLPTLIKDPELQSWDLSFYKTMGMGGTPLTHAVEIELAEFMEKHGSSAKPSLGYGLSEITSASATELNRYYGKVGSVGIPLCGVNIFVQDTDTGEHKKIGETGELFISSPGLMQGYYKNQEETDACIFTDENGTKWMKTGDLGYIDEDGFLFITGKLKRIYTTRSDENSPIFHIFPDYIASVVSDAPSIKDAVVICLPHPVLKSIPIAFIVTDGGNAETICTEAMEYCREKLPGHSVPKAIYQIDNIPKNAIGKIDYEKLEKSAKERYQE